MGRFLGLDWVEKHITKSRRGFLRDDYSTPLRRETRRMRRVLLGEMLYNLQVVTGFVSVLGELAGGQIESAYAALEIARMLVTYRIDTGMKFRFVTASGVPRRDYDLSLRFSDGVAARAETKCKMEETKITLRTVEESLSRAKSQLPERVPGIIFVKIPRFWIDDINFATEILGLADRFLARSPSIVSVKYYTASIVRDEQSDGETLGEIIAFNERSNPAHRFRSLRVRNWHMFPDQPSAAPPRRMNYNGMPNSWQRLFVQYTEL